MPTERERRIWRMFQRRVREMEPELSRALLQGFRRLREQLGQADLARLIESTSLEKILSDHLSEAQINQAFRELRNQIPLTLEEATRLGAGAVPGLAASDVFDRMNPRVMDAIRELDTRVMQTLRDDVRETFRATVAEGLEEGVNPRAIARRARGTIGLAPNQREWVENFRRELETGDRAALRRRLRDRRFDSTLERALGSQGEYRQRLKAIAAADDVKPGVFYHGTTTDFDRFDPKKIGRRDFGNLGKGVYVANERSLADVYAIDNAKRFGGTPRVFRVEADLGRTADLGSPKLRQQIMDATGIDFPIPTDDEAASAAVRDYLRSRGYDSAKVGSEFVVFDSDRLEIVEKFDARTTPERMRARTKRRFAEKALSGERLSEEVLEEFPELRGQALPQSKIDRMVDRYRQRMIAFNAETNARTAALDANKRGARLAWQDGIENGAVSPHRLMRRWSSVGDSRVRPEHEKMDGEEVPFTEPYSNGQMIPGETEYNCRCIDIIFLAESPIPAAT